MKRYVKLLGFFILGLMLWRVDLSALGQILGRCRLEMVFAALGIVLVAVAVKAVRWQLMLSAQGLSYPLRRAVLVYMSGIYIGVVTPGRLGELARVVYLRRDTGVNVGMGLSSIVVDRLFDLYALLFVGLAALFRFGLSSDFSLPVGVAVVVFFVSPLLLLNPRLGRWFSDKVLARAVRRRFASALVDGTDEFFSGLERLRSLRLLFSVALTALSYLILFAAAFMLTRSAGIDIGFWDAALSLGLANLLALLPITVAGVGTRDAVFVFAFAALGLSSAAALAYSALVLAVCYLGTGLAGFFCFWATNRDGKLNLNEESATQAAVDHVGDHADGENL